MPRNSKSAIQPSGQGLYQAATMRHSKSPGSSSLCVRALALTHRVNSGDRFSDARPAELLLLYSRACVSCRSLVLRRVRVLAVGRVLPTGGGRGGAVTWSGLVRSADGTFGRAQGGRLAAVLAGPALERMARQIDAESKI